MADERTIALTVAELDCADEARQIEGAVAAMPGVVRVQTAVGARKAIVTFDPARVAPEAIQQAIRGLGMSVDEPPPAVGAAARLGRQIGWVFVSGVALVALVGIVGERLGILERVTDLVPPWVAVLAVLVGGYPIFRNVVHALRNRAVTAHALMTLGIAGALAIGQYGAAAVIVFFMRFADFLEGFTTERSRQAISALLSLAPERARVLRGGQETECLADEVQRGEVVLVKPGSAPSVNRSAPQSTRATPAPSQEEPEQRGHPGPPIWVDGAECLPVGVTQVPPGEEPMPRGLRPRPLMCPGGRRHEPGSRYAATEPRSPCERAWPPWAGPPGGPSRAPRKGLSL